MVGNKSRTLLKAASEVAYLSYGAVIVIVTDKCPYCGCCRGQNPPHSPQPLVLFYVKAESQLVTRVCVCVLCAYLASQKNTENT